jgi:N-acetyl-anhydromuramyl-L-alanine amidase AmpD
VILDLRVEQPDPPPLVRGRRKHLVRDGHVVVRDPATIDGIVVHQTACVFSASGTQIRAAEGNRDLARHRRALGVACHALAFRDGVVVLANPLRWYVWHANRLNARSLGLEVEGRYPGDPWTQQQANATALALLALVREGRDEGMPLRYIWAHRQSSATRAGDPGRDIWRLVVEVGRGLGLETQPEMKVKSGQTIPPEWAE